MSTSRDRLDDPGCGDRQDPPAPGRVVSQDAPLELGKEWLAGFDDELDFLRPLYLPLPAIDGGEPRQLIDAGGEALASSCSQRWSALAYRAGAEQVPEWRRSRGWQSVSGAQGPSGNSGYYTGKGNSTRPAPGWRDAELARCARDRRCEKDRQNERACSHST